MLVAGALVLAGCGVRLETPPPVEPSPDATEQVRGRTVDDALGLADAATAVVASGVDEPVRVVLDDVAAFSARHAEELGGVYDSGLPDPTPTPSPTTSAPVVTDVTELLDELAADAARATQDADLVPDPDLARLVASVAVARDALADRLAAVADLPRPAPAADPAAAGDASGDAAPSAGASPADASPTDDGDPTAGSPAAAALALAHDEAAWTFTVLAARSSDATRTTMLEAAARHRTASDAWARAAGVVGRPADPRRTAYALPAGLDDPAVLAALPRTLEQSVADASAGAVAQAPAGERLDAVASLRAATAAAVAWGAAPVPFPGMPELGTAPVR
ncbi:DUF4439 domain-containing protein [Cellulomonas dongxiuzhuiae]|uniref:Ferritin-like domain-containing protein n=1 Tax=Cellulomonas dongxiuzhuiae TaxID=2819979 RepID=A0ABX8GNZ1_9CELL|nr:DUF4439 domain-containing protein [Cellulomonas dongxiuzhuiae]MBO3096109.1 DUF4439 domain-containing protein [Cellulomonas dongxiuzhuiae]QWC17377.1 ferritin-like domain-containing protein [Cellulomonas dongxiuzhuiae]